MIGVSHLTTEEIKVGLSGLSEITHCLPLCKEAGGWPQFATTKLVMESLTLSHVCRAQGPHLPSWPQLSWAYVGPLGNGTLLIWIWEGVLVDDREKQCGCCAGLFLINPWGSTTHMWTQLILLKEKLRPISLSDLGCTVYFVGHLSSSSPPLTVSLLNFSSATEIRKLKHELGYWIMRFGWKTEKGKGFLGCLKIPFARMFLCKP